VKTQINEERANERSRLDPGCLIIFLYIYIKFIYKFKHFQFKIVRRILSDFQRDHKPKLIESIMNNIHD